MQYTKLDSITLDDELSFNSHVNNVAYVSRLNSTIIKIHMNLKLKNRSKL